MILPEKIRSDFELIKILYFSRICWPRTRQRNSPSRTFSWPWLKTSQRTFRFFPSVSSTWARAVNIKNLQNCQEIVLGRTVSEIPPKPPFKKGRLVGDSTLRGGFLAGPCFHGKSWLLVAALPICEELLKIDSAHIFEQSLNFRGNKGKGSKWGILGFFP